MAKQSFFEGTDTQTRVLVHGGREAVRFTAQLPRGESCAAYHTRAVCEALLSYAQRELLPAAAEELECAVRAGQGYTFRPHRYHVSLKTYPARRRACVEVIATHTRGGEILSHRSMSMYWSTDGNIQHKR